MFRDSVELKKDNEGIFSAVVPVTYSAKHLYRFKVDGQYKINEHEDKKHGGRLDVLCNMFKAPDQPPSTNKADKKKKKKNNKKKQNNSDEHAEHDDDHESEENSSENKNTVCLAIIIYPIFIKLLCRNRNHQQLLKMHGQHFHQMIQLQLRKHLKSHQIKMKVRIMTRMIVERMIIKLQLLQVLVLLH